MSQPGTASGHRCQRSTPAPTSGTAIGIVMERYGIDRNRAFGCLRAQLPDTQSQAPTSAGRTTSRSVGSGGTTSSRSSAPSGTLGASRSPTAVWAALAGWRSRSRTRLPRRQAGSRSPASRRHCAICPGNERSGAQLPSQREDARADRPHRRSSRFAEVRVRASQVGLQAVAGFPPARDLYATFPRLRASTRRRGPRCP